MFYHFTKSVVLSVLELNLLLKECVMKIS
jgi:hypothetical protein